ncbi:hypothetical protein U3A55_07840 [Salarchaeum sp. III]|uniref:hypothetical protein n=1 Tax=Salarchaeum sp. III TaxID=3107927 RepID=UPI002EDB8454
MASTERVVVLRAGPSVVHDGSTVNATVRVDVETGNGRERVYRGTSLSKAMDAAIEELENGGFATVRDREYFSRFWSADRVTDVARRLREAAYR